jgi:RIO-like serine/threonine protein kinase
VFVVEIAIASGAELKDRLLEQGLSPDEVILKYCWPRYAPPPDSGIRAIVKSESLGAQFERVVAMHREAPAGFPMPVATVTSAEGEFVGYLLEYVSGETLQSLIALGMLDEARRRLGVVEAIVARLHAKSIAHGDLNASNIVAADDGRTLLIDPVANQGPGTMLQDELCMRQIRRQLDEAT